MVLRAGISGNNRGDRRRLTVQILQRRRFRAKLACSNGANALYGAHRHAIHQTRYLQFYLFGAILHCSNPNETAEAAPASAFALRQYHPFHPPDRRGQLTRGAVFETDGERGVVGKIYQAVLFLT